MKTETILTRVYAIMELCKEDNPVINHELSNLANDLAAQVRMEYAASRGQGNATKAIVSMMDAVKKRDLSMLDAVNKRNPRRTLHYAWMDANGHQCVCDGYRAFRLTEALPLEERPDDAGDPINLDKAFPNLNDYATMPLPSAQEVKAYIALKRAEYGRRYSKEAPKVWDFGEYKPAANSHYLLDLLTVLPDATEIYYKPSCLVAPLYAKGERGEALLLPVMTPEKKQQYAKMKNRKSA